MANTYFAHGATGAVAVQGYATGASVPTTFVTLAVKSWKGTLTKAQHGASNTSVPGFTVTQPGKATLKVSIDAQLALNSAGTAYDQTHNPVSVTGPDLQADYCALVLVGGITQSGAAVSSVTNTTPNQIFNVPTAVIESFEISNMEGDLIDYTISAVSSGAFTINQGS